VTFDQNVVRSRLRGEGLRDHTQLVLRLQRELVAARKDDPPQRTARPDDRVVVVPVERLQRNDHGLPVNLGGGITPEDSLDKFKRGFANAQAPWYTHEVICDPAAYRELASRAGQPPEGFFPAYRG
jgi:hypothetical protein